MMPKESIELETEIDLFELVRYLRRYRFRILFVSAIAGVLSLISVLLIDNRYEATSILAPASEDASGGLAGIAGQFGGLASLAGISLGDSGSATTNALAVLKSQAFVTGFIRKHELKRVLFPEQWNEESNSWKEPNFFLDAVSNLKRALKGNVQKQNSNLAPFEPLDVETYELFMEDYLRVSEDKKTGLITISMETNDPALSVAWLTSFVRAINEYMRSDAMMQSERNVEFLSKEMESTSLVEMQKAISKLVEVHIKTKMLANVNEEFAFKMLAEPVFPEKQSFPKRLQIILISVFLTASGALIFLSIVFIRRAGNFVETQ